MSPLITIALFYFFALGVSSVVYSRTGRGYERAPVFWILYLGAIMAFFVQAFPEEVVALFPPHSYGFIIGADIFLLFAALVARLELVGRHPNHELFLKNRTEFVRMKPQYLLVKSVEVFLQQLLFGVAAIVVGGMFADPLVATFVLATLIALIHLPIFLWVRPALAASVVASSFLLGISVGASVLILHMGIAVSLPLHWLAYLGGVPYLWRMCEKGTCPFA